MTEKRRDVRIAFDVTSVEDGRWTRLSSSPDMVYSIPAGEEYQMRTWLENAIREAVQREKHENKEQRMIDAMERLARALEKQF